MGNKGSDLFRFKEFECRHGSGSMKIGVDAVLVGSWAEGDAPGTILDVGTGCGVIALMCAQRFGDARIAGIDVDEASVREATANFAASKWSGRLRAVRMDFNDFEDGDVEGMLEGLYGNVVGDIDLIISNPPYFESGIDHPDTPRLRARHAAELSPRRILEIGSRLLSARGRIAMIVPADRAADLVAAAASYHLFPHRQTQVKGHPQAPAKRTLLEFTRPPATAAPAICGQEVSGPIASDQAAGKPAASGQEVSEPAAPDILILEDSPGNPTAAHRRLCHPFYLKF